MTAKNFVVYLIESESGWGQKVDETKYFATYEEAEKFVNTFNAENDKATVPDWYMYATSPERYHQR